MCFNKQRSLIAICLAIAVSTGACSRDSDLMRTSNKIEKNLLAKIKAGDKLNASDINNLSGIYSVKKQYREGISAYEQLGKDDKYKNEKYLIYLGLSKLYLEQASETRANNEKVSLLDEAKRYLMLGVDASKEKATALYLRSEIYGYSGCIEKAKKDLQDAKKLAEGKELILYEEGMYLTKDKFISLLQRNLDSLNKLTDNCEIH
jgi:tetratricopeptide (TPR) repeat protein